MDLIKREDAIEIAYQLRRKPNDEEWAEWVKSFNAIPSADESEEYEWCHDCKEYDTEKHCCPRWNKVIRQTVAELEADRSERWIPCSERLPEETADYLCWVINPYDESIQYYMICTYYAGAKKWCPIDETASDNVVAWQPLPKPWKGADDDIH